MPPSPVPIAPPLPTFREASGTWALVGLNSFGGPAGQIAVMHRMLVEERRWISEERFLHALNYCMLLPGPEAQQLAVYVGWLLHGTAGGLVAGTLFVLPGMLAILALSFVYAAFGNVGLVAGLFFGLKPAVLAIVVEAVLRIGKRALRNGVLRAIAVLAFLAIFFLGVPFPWIVAGAAAAGLAGGRLRPDLFPGARPHGPAKSGPGAPAASVGGSAATVGEPAATVGEPAASAGAPPPSAGETLPALDAAFARGELGHTRPSLARAARVALVCGAAWFGPLLLVRMALGAEHVLLRVGTFFSQVAVVTFGGAYAVLAYLAQAAVETYGWLAPGEMLDGLGLAETTPGPLIMVVQFVGFLAGFRAPAPFSPYVAATLAALLTTWVTFVPCFLWIFLGAPWVEALRGSRALSAALSGITAAVVGVVLNLALWFALHTLFGRVAEQQVLGLRLLVPEGASVSWPAVVLAGAALLATFRAKVGMLTVLGGCAALGAAWTYFAA